MQKQRNLNSNMVPVRLDFLAAIRTRRLSADKYSDFPKNLNFSKVILRLDFRLLRARP